MQKGEVKRFLPKIKKWLPPILCILLVVSVAGFLYYQALISVLPEKQIGKFIPGVTTPEDIKKWPPLCIKVERDVDFTVLADVHFILSQYSVFMSPNFKDVLGDTRKDQAYLMRQILNTVFGFLAVSPDQIPQWARQLVEDEITTGNYDYAVFNQIYQKLCQDPKYSYLKSPEQKEKILQVAIEGMIKALEDPFDQYFPPEIWKLGIAESTTGRYRGLGISVNKNERGEIVITSVSPGSPAEKADLRVGDAILAVDGKSTAGCSINQFILHIKTRENLTMTFILQRGLTGELEEVIVIMEEIKLRHLLTFPGIDLPDGRGSTAENFPYFTPIQDRERRPHPEILYIIIKEFSVQVAEDLRYLLENLDMANFKGVIVDIRGNPGGRLDAILDCVDYFLPSADPITSIRYSDGRGYTYYQDRWNFVPPELPIVIIVDKNSASGAELFPAALRENGRAVVISRDERTAGKGSVNNFFELRKGEYGGLYVSIGLWYTPKGELIESMDLDKDGYYEIGGIRPDIRVNWTHDDYLKNQRDPAWYDLDVFAAIDYIGRYWSEKS